VSGKVGAKLVAKKRKAEAKRRKAALKGGDGEERKSRNGLKNELAMMMLRNNLESSTLFCKVSRLSAEPANL
jgi:hypothetical protein